MIKHSEKSLVDNLGTPRINISHLVKVFLHFSVTRSGGLFDLGLVFSVQLLAVLCFLPLFKKLCL
jgi:hypothetical protein